MTIASIFVGAYCVPVSEAGVQCHFCGRVHVETRVCPTIKAVRFDKLGMPTRIEFFQIPEET